MPPPRKFFENKLNLVAFQSIKKSILLDKLKTSYMDEIWENISTATVIILFVHTCLNIANTLECQVTVNKNGND